MKMLTLAATTVILSLFSISPAMAEGDHDLQLACKAECPAAKTEDEAHKCMDEVAKKKKDDRKFRKSDCFATYKAHAEHEKEEGHKH